MTKFKLIFSDGDWTYCNKIVDCNGKVVESLEEFAKVLMTQEFFVSRYKENGDMWMRSSYIDAFSISDLS